MGDSATGSQKVTPKDQKSAATLSIWHCILAWFFMNAEKYHLEVKESKTLLLELFGKMDTLRKIIHNTADDSCGPTNDTISGMAKKLTVIVKGIPQGRWAEEINSMMHEMMAMHCVLKEHKNCLITCNPNDFVFVRNNRRKHFACIITIWYWLAAWSSDLKGTEQSTKNDFLKQVESHNNELGNQFFDVETSDPETGQPIHDMMSKLLLMLKQKPDHWVHVLEHFTESMIEAGSIRGHVKATVHAALKTKEMVYDQASSTSGLTLDPKLIRPVTSHPIRGLFRNSLVNSTDASPVVHIIDELKEPIGKLIEHLPETVKDFTDKAADVTDKAIGFGKDIVEKASSAVETVYNDVKSVVENVDDGVHHLVHGIGEGVQKFAHTVSSWFHHLF